MKKNTQGFTLVELMVVIVIIAILAVGAITWYHIYMKRAHDAQRLADIQTIRNTILVDYASEDETYPSLWDIQSKIASENGQSIQDPKFTKIACLESDGVTKQECRYEYSTCDSAIGYILSVRLESKGSVRMYDDIWDDENALEYMSSSGCDVIDGTITL